MVKIITKRQKTYYQCAVCGFLYAEKETAERCQKWCTEHKSCNNDIVKHAVQED